MNCRNSSTTLLRRTSQWCKAAFLGAAFAWAGSAGAQVTVTATGVGPGPTVYTSLNAAFTAINAGTHQGAITCTITADYAEPAVAVPLLASGGASSYTSILVTPSGNRIVSSAAAPTASRGVIEIQGADNVTIDGDDAGTGGVRNLTFQAAAVTTTGVAVIRFASTSTTNGATNCTIRNCVVIGSRAAAASTVTNYGIYSGTAIAANITTSGQSDNNDNLTIENNEVRRCYWGIYVAGTTANKCDNLIIRNNVVGNATPADAVANRGIYVQNTQTTASGASAIVELNDVRLDYPSAGSNDIAGVEIANGNAGLFLRRNRVHDIYEANTGGQGAYGVWVSGATENAGIEISNNFIWDIRNDHWSTSISATSVDIPIGLRVSAAATGMKILSNSISMHAPNSDPATGGYSAAIQLTTTGITGSDIRNNIIRNTQTGTALSVFYCMVVPAAFPFATLSNNAYYAPNANTYVGWNGANRQTLATWQTATGLDAGSISMEPPFNSTTDLTVNLSHPNAGAFNGTGASGTGIAIDIQGDSRGTPPDIGADEFILLTCGSADGGTITPATASACAGGTYVMTATGATTGAGITNQWQVSLTPGGPYLPVVGGSGATSTSYTTGALAPGTYYYVMTNTCSAGPVSDDSDELTLTVNPTPTASASNDGPACVGASVNLTGTTDIGTSYSWSGPNAFSSTMQNPTVSPLVLASAGTYSFTATAAGCPSAAGTTTVVVNPAPVITSTTATPNPTCFNGDSQLNVNVVPPAVNNYTMTGSAGTFTPLSGATTVPSIEVDDLISGVLPIGFTFNYAGGSYTTFRASSNGFLSFNAAAADAATNSLAAPTAGRLPLVAPLWDDLDGSLVGTASYLTTGTAPNRVFTFEWLDWEWNYQALGAVISFQVKLYEANGNVEFVYDQEATAYNAGTTGGASIGIAGGAVGQYLSLPDTGVDPTESSAVEVSNMTIKPASGQVYTFSPPAAAYLWTPNTFLDSDVIANPYASGINVASQAYSVDVTAGGCTSTATVTVTTSAPITAATIAPDPAAFCAGGSVNLTATPTDGAGPYTYQWADPDLTPAGTNAIQNVTVAGTWSVEVFDNCGGSVTVTRDVTENALPTVTISPVPANATICGGVGNVVMTAGGAVSYTWAPTTALAPTSGSPVTSTATATTTYTVTGTDANGCVNTATQTVSVGANPTMGAVTATPAAICDGEDTQLSATATLPFPGYSGAAASYALEPCAANAGPSGDDVVSAALPIGFTFNFYGVPFTDFGISTNGNIQLGTGAYSNQWTDVAIPNGAVPNNMIALAWDDWFPGAGEITYELSGTPGSQKLAVCFTTSGRGGGVADNIDGQIVLEEGTDNIYLTVTNKNVSTNPTTQGIENAAGNAGSVAVPGRNSVPWSATNDTYVFSPNVASISYSWLPVTFLDNAAIATPFATAVTPLPATYTVTATSALGCTGTGTVTITEDLTDTDGDLISDCNDNCPSLFGQIGDFCDADGGPAFLFGQIDGTCTCVAVPCTENVTIELRTDANSDQASWEILLQNTAQVVCNGGGYPPNILTPITETCCLPVGCYRLRVLDSGGDGFVTGGYQLRETGVSGRRIIDNLGNFLTGSTSALANTLDNGAFCVPLSNDKPIFSSCDKLDWVNYQFIVATENLAVTAQYNPTAPIASQPTNLNSGYEFWFYNPNGGYSYRRFRNHATSDGFGSGATRACHFKINKLVPVPPGNQNTNLEIPYNTLLNVRIRARVNGVNQPFGAACQFKMDAARAFCPLAKLQDNPLNVTDFSCGVFKNFGGPNSPSNRITANPPQFAPAATAGTVRYQFRFRIPGENICIVRPAQTSATLVMNWAGADSLECGKTYLVEVRVSRTSGATWCVDSPTPACHPNPVTIWGKICNVTINPCFQGGGGGNSLAVETNSALTMYPNPNQGDQLFFSLSGVETGVGTVSVDIFDMAGKRVSARTLAVQDGTVNTTMELNGELAGGMYVVNITAGDKTYTERLVIQP